MAAVNQRQTLLFAELVMVAAIGASSVTTPTTAGKAASGAGLQVELARVKKEYSACVNCESAKTGAGQRNIQQLDTQIQQLTARIAAVTPTSSSNANSAPSAATTSTATAPAMIEDSTLGNSVNLFV